MTNTKVPGERHVLVAWWGALAFGEETIGDLYALRAVANQLKVPKSALLLASDTPYTELAEFQISNWRTLDPSTIHTLIFVCGPIIGDSPEFRQLLNRFQNSRRIAVGVTLLPTASPRYWNPFDCVLVRDQDGIMSIGDFAEFEQREAPVSVTDHPVIGVCMRGEQMEYGVGMSMHEEAQIWLDGMLSRVNGTVRILDTRLHSDGTSAQRLISDVDGCDAIVTSRMHGALLSLARGIPVLAIDQVRGGGKVSAVIGATGWPLLIHADDMPTGFKLDSLINQLLSDSARLNVAKAQQRIKAIHAIALNKLADLNILPITPT
jgi:hypothetical protein